MDERGKVYLRGAWNGSELVVPSWRRGGGSGGTTSGTSSGTSSGGSGRGGRADRSRRGGATLQSQQLLKNAAIKHHAPWTHASET